MSAPTLLIGLGGTGCKVIERVSRLVTPEQRQNIAMVAFDTDINELRGIQARNPLVRIIQTSTRQTVGEYLNIDQHARDSWFPVNAILNGKVLSEGAGQVRSISRLAFESVIRAGRMEPLHEAIQSLYKVEEDKADQALRVVITSSLAGGTGSGLILPVALYVKNYLESHFRLSGNITRGFFILPEVFYEVIPGVTERNNLKANAYATLRELDAFLMKGDATLPGRYRRSVRMQFPRAAADGFEEYDIRPYDFCFLFDAQNADGGKLNSFDQYLDHAANCIYAQSIAPTNKRSNSSEDNTIRKLAKERGRNRYAGAGASMLIYPFEDIRTLIALKWAKQTISKQWLVYDEIYKSFCKENAAKRERGLVVNEQPLSTFYMNQVDSAAKHDDPFATAIIKSTGTYTNGVTRNSNRWEDYLQAVIGKIEKDLSEGTTDLTSKQAGARRQVSALDKDWEDYISTYADLKEYYQMASAYADEVAQSIAYSMFQGSGKAGGFGKEYQLDTYLSTSDGNFLHPNAVRYLLTRILDLMKIQKQEVDQERDRSRKYFDEFEVNTFDDKSTEDVVETVDDLESRKRSLPQKLLRRPSADQEEIKRKLKSYYDRVETYQKEYVQSVVYGQGIAYISSIVDALESFYQSFDSKIEGLDGRISEIYRKYSDRKGSTVRYVCASRECLDAIVDKKVYTGSGIHIDSGLARTIYDKVLAYAMMEDKPKSNRYYSDLFDEDILKYFEDSVMKSYGNTLDVDIITALKNEAEYTILKDNPADADNLVEQYVVKTITDTRRLSCPFIEKPLGEAVDALYSCTFSSELIPERGDESRRANLIRKELMNNGGVPDDGISKNRIMFYQSFYGLRANNLSKFAPPETALTYRRNGGEYFTAYYKLVEGIHPNPGNSREISPHIDKWWHIVTKMPDLDDGYQKKQEYDIYAAFFWAILCRYVELAEEGRGKKVYKLKAVRLRMDDDRLFVSNGTECDKLYEVLDAIAIYPELVQKILADVEEEITADVNDNSPLEEGMLCSYLQSYRIDSPGIGKEGESSRSIFDLPMLMKKSSTPDVYYEEDVIEMLKVEIAEIHRYLARFCSEKDLPEIIGGLIMEQFERHLEAAGKEKELHETIYRESLFRNTCEVVIQALIDYGCRKEARELEKKIADLR